MHTSRRPTVNPALALIVYGVVSFIKRKLEVQKTRELKTKDRGMQVLSAVLRVNAELT
jgi:hypothetical protein